MSFGLLSYLLIFAAWTVLPGCAGLPAQGSVGGQVVATRVDTEVARYYLEQYLTNRRDDAVLDRRIDRVYGNPRDGLPGRGELKRLSDDFSVDFAALYFADRIARVPGNRELRASFDRAVERAPESLLELSALAADYEVVFVPGYLYKRHPGTGADFSAPRAALKRAGVAHYFVETEEDGAIEANAAKIAGEIGRRLGAGRKLLLVSVSKSGPEVAAALTRLGPRAAGGIAAWVNVVGTLQGSPLADESLLQWEDLVGKLDRAGVESLGTERSRRRFARFRIARDILVVNYIGIPLSGSVSMLARDGFLQLRAHGPNDGLSLLSDLIYPESLTLAELGRDHFLIGDHVEAATIALALTVIRRSERREATLDVNDHPAGRSLSSADGASSHVGR